MKNFIRKNRFGLILLLPGALGGFLYWYYIGCNSGTCPITSVWHNSAIYGAILGFVAGNIFDDRRRKKAGEELKTEQANNNK